MLLLLKEELKSHQYAKVCYIIRISLTTAHSICNLKFNVPNEIPVVYHNGSNYDYHFIIKE